MRQLVAERTENYQSIKALLFLLRRKPQTDLCVLQVFVSLASRFSFRIDELHFDVASRLVQRERKNKSIQCASSDVRSFL